MADACGIQDPQGAIALGTPFLWIKRMISGATKGVIGLWDKSGAGKAMGKGRTCPLGRAVCDQGRLLLRRYRLAFRIWQSLTCWGKFGGAQLGRGERLPQFQAQVPDPLREDLAKLLAARRMGVPAIRRLLVVFISEHRLKRSAIQVEVEYIRGGKGRLQEQRRWHHAEL